MHDEKWKARMKMLGVLKKSKPFIFLFQFSWQLSIRFMQFFCLIPVDMGKRKVNCKLWCIRLALASKLINLGHLAQTPIHTRSILSNKKRPKQITSNELGICPYDFTSVEWDTWMTAATVADVSTAALRQFSWNHLSIYWFSFLSLRTFGLDFHTRVKWNYMLNKFSSSIGADWWWCRRRRSVLGVLDKCTLCFCTRSHFRYTLHDYTHTHYTYLSLLTRAIFAYDTDQLCVGNNNKLRPGMQRNDSHKFMTTLMSILYQCTRTQRPHVGKGEQSTHRHSTRIRSVKIEHGCMPFVIMCSEHCHHHQPVAHPSRVLEGGKMNLGRAKSPNESLIACTNLCFMRCMVLVSIVSHAMRIHVQWALVGHLNYSWRCNKFSPAHVFRKPMNRKSIEIYGRCGPTLLTISSCIPHYYFDHCIHSTLEARIICPCAPFVDFRVLLSK